MRITAAAALGIGLLLAGASMCPEIGAAVATTGGIDWRTDLDAALTEAEESGRPLLAVFS